MDQNLIDLIQNGYSLFAFFPDDELQLIDFQKYVLDVRSGDVLIQENHAYTHLFISITTDIELVEEQRNSNSLSIGFVSRGRSANLHNFLHDLPAQYTLKAKSDGQILALPKHILTELWKKYPSTYTYLVRVTESNDYRQLSKEFKSMNVSSPFLAEFLSHLNEITLENHHYLARENDSTDFVHFMAEGSLVCRHNNMGSSWLIPPKSWIGWQEFSLKKDYDYTIISSAKTRVLSISCDQLNKLKQKYAIDFEKLDAWITQGVYQPQSTSNRNQEIESIEDLFKDSVMTSKWHLKYPWVSQNDEMDCGPACLSMISHYFGKQTSVQFWRSKLSTDLVGTSIYDLAKTTEKFGYISHCLSVPDLTEVDSFLFPFIALRKYHYVVVYKIKNGQIIFGDPGVGIRELSLNEFLDGFEQIGLFLKPNTDFEQLPDSKSEWKHFLGLFHGFKRDFTLASICAVLVVLISLIPPFIGQLLLDEVLIQKNVDLFWIFTSALFGLALFVAFISWSQSYYFISIINKFNFRASSVFVQKMLSLPYHFFSTRHVGDFTHRLNEMAHLRYFVTHTLLGVFLNLMTLFIYGGALFLIDTQLAFYVLLLAPPLMIAPLLFSKKLSQLYGEVFSKSTEQSSTLTDYVKGVSVIKAMGAEHTQRLRFEGQLIDLVSANNNFSMTSLNVETLTTSYHQIVNLVISSLCIYQGLQGQMSIGKVISFTLIASKFLSPLLSISRQWDQFIEMKSVLHRLNDIFLTPSESSKNQLERGKYRPSQFRGEVEFKDVWFRYGGVASDWVLKGLNFKIEAGQKVAIVGPSGSGKSTIANLLTRIYEPSLGHILIDGRDYREYDIDWLREKIGLLHQESFLFRGTIGENIAFNHLVANENEIEVAAKKAAAFEFIDKKPMRFNSYIPHGGIGFSGGEKQKLCLSRLFFSKPSLVILDEATSALDGISETEVLNSLYQDIGTETILNIAHRYSTVRRSEFTLVIMDGKFAGFGPTELLEKNNAIFKKLFGLELGTHKKPSEAA